MFLLNISKFLDQITDVEHCNLFITTLTNENTTLTMFNAQYPEHNILSQDVLQAQSNDDELEEEDDNKSKVNKICSALRHCLFLRMENDENYLKLFYTAVLSSFVLEKPSRVAEALNNLKSKLEKSILIYF